MFLPANDMRDTHQLVVDDHRHVIRRETVAFLDDKIAQLRRLDAHLPANLVFNDNGFFPWNGKPHRYGAPAGFGSFNIGRGRVLIGTRIQIVSLFLLGPQPHFRQFFRRIKTAIGLLLIDKLLDVFIVDIPPLGLMIRRVRTADIRALVPVDPQPFQVFEYLIGRGSGIALHVRIFNAQQELAARLASQKPVKQSRPGAPNMEIAGRRRCKPCYDHKKPL